MRFAVLMIFVLCIGLCFPVFAEYYKYVNQEGVVCYTDDLSQIPEKQRVVLKKFFEIQTNLQQKVESERKEAPLKTTQTVSESKGNELRRMSRELDKEFLLLKLERESLVEMQKDLDGEEALAEFNIRANALNQRVIIFEKRKADYEKQVNEYNKQIEK